MIGYMSLEEQVDKDFRLARRRHYSGASVPGCEETMRLNGCFYASMISERSPGQRENPSRSMRTVPLSQIGGSVGRCSEFDGDFMPLRRAQKIGGSA